MATRHCNFCAASQHEVAILIASNNETFICDDCVSLCVEIIAEKRQPGEAEYQSWLQVLREPYRVIEFGQAYHWPEAS